MTVTNIYQQFWIIDYCTYNKVYFQRIFNVNSLKNEIIYLQISLGKECMVLQNSSKYCDLLIISFTLLNYCTYVFLLNTITSTLNLFYMNIVKIISISRVHKAQKNN